MHNTPWLKEFPALDCIDPCNFDSIVYQMHRMLDDFAYTSVPENGYTIDDLVLFVTSLVKRQNGPGTFITWGGNWSLIPTNEGAPSDVRVALIFFPSYLAVSFLSLFCRRYEKEAVAIPGFFEALHEGLYFITGRKLFGHGMEGDDERHEAVRILLKGEVHHYLLENRITCEKCRALYEELICFKADILRVAFPTFESLELIRALKNFPNLSLTETPYFSWCPDINHTGIIIEAPYTVPPGSEISIGEVVIDVVEKTGCAGVVGRVSKEKKRYTGRLSHDNKDTVKAYNEIIRQIVEAGNETGRNNTNKHGILHIILRGMDNSHGVDVELSSRNGLSCDTRIMEKIANHLRHGLEGYSRRIYTVTANNLFGGGSLYLDYFRDGYPVSPEIKGFGLEYNVLEIRLSRILRNSALGRIKDLLVRFINENQYSWNMSK